jgi:hypothetical protein
MHVSRNVTAVLFAITLGVGVTACEKKHEGPAERAGAKIDAAANDVKASAQDAKKDIEKAAADAKKDVKE